ncbi:hypothetical protein BCD48_09195 [Pseudofrankia sp. BMG5.36]|nr:hypothetical protein BCD48_09195 [Pseudofrankia sp. BMG5.36]
MARPWIVSPATDGSSPRIAASTRCTSLNSFHLMLVAVSVGFLVAPAPPHRREISGERAE